VQGAVGSIIFGTAVAILFWERKLHPKEPPGPSLEAGGRWLVRSSGGEGDWVFVPLTHFPPEKFTMSSI